MWPLLKLKRFWFGLSASLLIVLLASSSGVRLILQQAPLEPKIIPDLPALTSNTAMLNGLEENLYGEIPTLSDVTIISKREIARNAFTEGDSVTEWAVEAGFGAKRRLFHIVFVKQNKLPNTTTIITQNFCPNSDVVPIEGVTAPTGDFFDCSGDGLINSFFEYFFGQYITVPPYEMILQQGYNLAVMHPPEFLPDTVSGALAASEELFGDKTQTPGALAVWSSLSIWLANTLKTNDEAETVVTYGHSRYAKTALISAAASGAIDGVIAHQSGTGGASLIRDETGESLKQIVKNYPHWFVSNISKYIEAEKSLPVDSHYLLALIAPRPVMLGNARRDVWSDPAGAFNAAQVASKAWQLEGHTGLTAKRLDDFRPQDDISFWMRSGTHGVVEEDWPAFLEFMDAHFH